MFFQPQGNLHGGKLGNHNNGKDHSNKKGDKKDGDNDPQVI